MNKQLFLSDIKKVVNEKYNCETLEPNTIDSVYIYLREKYPNIILRAIDYNYEKTLYFFDTSNKNELVFTYKIPTVKKFIFQKPEYESSDSSSSDEYY